MPIMNIIEKYHQLPAATIAEKLNTELLQRHAAVVVAPPGAGKSTLLPLTMLSRGAQGRIVMLEPRRLAARQVALRMAQMLGEEVGQTVGYQIRFEKKISLKTRIEVVTEGILTRRLVEDPTLEGVSCVIFDEFHERSLQSDLAFCLTQEARSILRSDLDIVVMSATIDATAICQALGAREVSCQGRMYPVETVLSKDDILPNEIAEAVAATVSRAHREQEGDILAFLPGQADIVRCAELLGCSLGATHVCELYGNLPPQQQYEAISPSAPGERKVVLATPIAETSLTIEGIRIVVDSGYYRKLVFDPTSDLSHLETVRISMDMARQRAGRAGRVAAGTCFRLWTHATQQRMEDQRQPEIMDADLVPMVQEVAAFGETDVERLPWLTPPPKGNVARAANELRALHAINAEGQITPLGRKMVAMPCHPRIARMILQARNAQEKSLACDIAAILEEKDVMAQESNACSDLLLRVSALQDARRRNALGRWKRIGNIAAEYDRMVGIRPSNAYVAREDIGALVAAAYPGRIAKAVDHNGNYRMANGEEVMLDAADPLTSFPWLAVATLHAGNGGRGRAFLAAPVSSQSLEDYATWWDNITWIAHQGGVVVQKEMRIGTLVVKTRPLDNVPKEQLERIICEAAKKEGRSMFSWTDKTAALQERVVLVAQWHPELGLPDLSTDAVLRQPEKWLPFYLEKGGKVVTTVSEMRKMDMESVLWNMLSYEQQQEVDRLAPTYIVVPSGSKVQLRYRKGSEAPVLSVRLQECFGLTATPRVNDGKIPVLMELLSPGFKPVQLTADLQSFWQDTYFEVRKELRRRYPKHYWPDNPLEAVAQRGVKRKR